MGTKTCTYCDGYGIVANYGNGEDFYGEKECRVCKGSGILKTKIHKACLDTINDMGIDRVKKMSWFGKNHG